MKLRDVRGLAARVLRPILDSARALFQRQPSPPPLDFVHVLEAENRHLSCPPLETLDDASRNDERTILGIVHQSDRSALCLSGGGIRSASFAIGVMEGL